MQFVSRVSTPLSSWSTYQSTCQIDSVQIRTRNSSANEFGSHSVIISHCAWRKGIVCNMDRVSRSEKAMQNSAENHHDTDSPEYSRKSEKFLRTCLSFKTADVCVVIVIVFDGSLSYCLHCPVDQSIGDWIILMDFHGFFAATFSLIEFHSINSS